MDNHGHTERILLDVTFRRDGDATTLDVSPVFRERRSDRQPANLNETLIEAFPFQGETTHKIVLATWSTDSDHIDVKPVSTNQLVRLAHVLT